MRAKRIDGNQNEIVSAFRSLGCTVFVTSMVGKGFPDIVVGCRGKNYLFEIKDGTQPVSCQKLTAHEKTFQQTWSGHYAIINSVEHVMAFIKNNA